MTAMPPTQAVGSGKVTDAQVAFMVECYLRDNNFNKTLEQFRSEAATVLHPLRTVPKGARSLHSVLNEYVVLKEENIRVETEKSRVDDLFRGLQEIVSSYQSGLASAIAVADKSNQCNPSLGTTTPRLPAIGAPNEAPVPVKEKKRKSCGSPKNAVANSATSNENSFPHSNTSADASKKPRHGLPANNKQVSPPPQGAMLLSPSYNLKTVQPGTPTSSSLNNVTPINRESEQHRMLTPSQGLISPSPLQNCTHTVSHHYQASQILSPARLPTQPMLQHHHVQQTIHHSGPRTPSAANSSASSSSASPQSAANPSSCADTVIKTNSRQHPRRSARNQAPATHYSTRAQKKLDSTSADVLQPSAAANKASKKKPGNSKCRLLDFSSAESDPRPLALQNTENFQDSRSSSSNCQINMLQPFPTDANSDTKSSQVCETFQPAQLAEGSAMVDSENPLPCDDTIFFDDMFEFEIDTNLISELQDLAPLEDDVTPHQTTAVNSTCSDSPSVAPVENHIQGVLTEATNVTHSDGVLHGSVCASPPASSNPKPLSDGTNMTKSVGSLNGSSLALSNSKNRKFVIRGGEVLISDKENLPVC